MLLNPDKMPAFHFVAKLLITESATIENRIAKLCTYIFNQQQPIVYKVRDIETNSTLENHLLSEIETKEYVIVNDDFITKLLHEDTQIIDLDIEILGVRNYYRILIIRNDEVNILSDDDSILIHDVLGEYHLLDTSLFEPFKEN